MGDGIGMRVNERREIRQVCNLRFIKIFKISIVEYACARSVYASYQRKRVCATLITRARGRKIIYITLIWDMRYKNYI